MGYGDTLLNPQLLVALPRTKFRFMARIARFVAAAASGRPCSWAASPPSAAAIQGRRIDGLRWRGYGRGYGDTLLNPHFVMW